jgi:nucleotide-binding universal stress UspA family protein
MGGRYAAGRVACRPVYRRILVGTDGSATAAKAVARAAQVAGATGATLVVLTAGSGPRAEQTAAAAARDLGDGVQVETKVRAGDPATVLTDEATQGYDLLVVGNKGMTGASRFLLGSVPNKVSHHSPCPLLIVHTT